MENDYLEVVFGKLPPRADPFLVPEDIRGIAGLRDISHHKDYLLPGIYFLCFGDQLLYIGQSINPLRRLRQHVKDKGFDRVFYLSWPVDKLNTMEGGLIRMFDPPLNRIYGATVTAADRDQIVGALWGKRAEPTIAVAIWRPVKPSKTGQLALAI